MADIRQQGRAAENRPSAFAADENGNVVLHTIYDEWGVSLTATRLTPNYSGLDNANNFTGCTWDETLNLYYAQARFYDPTAHRVTQQDPIQDGENWYAYVGNNPPTHTDPWWLARLSIEQPIDMGGSGITTNAIGTVNITLGNTSLLGKVFGQSVYASVDKLFATCGVCLPSGGGVWNDAAAGHLYQSANRTGAVVTFNRNQNILTITNPGTGETRTVYKAQRFGDPEALLSSYYIDVDYFHKLMCELGYTKQMTKHNSADANILLAGILTENDNKMQHTNPLAYSVLMQLNNTWVEVYKRTKQGYDTTGMEDDSMGLMKEARRIADSRILKADLITNRAGLSDLETVLDSGHVAFAELWTNAHEYTYASNFYEVSFLQALMDLKNNEIGYMETQGVSTRDITVPKDRIKHLVESGRLYIIQDGKLVPSGGQ